MKFFNNIKTPRFSQQFQVFLIYDYLLLKNDRLK